MAKITCKVDLLAVVLGGTIEPSSQVRDDNSNVWTPAHNNQLVAPLLTYPARLKRTRWLFLALSVVLGAGFHGWRTLLSFGFIFGILREAYVASVEAIELTRARQLLLYVSGIVLALLGFGVCDALIELARLTLFPGLAPDSDWLAIPLFVGIVLVFTAMSELIWERWKPYRKENLLRTVPDDHPVKARSAQILAKQARIRGLLGVDGCIRHSWPDGDRYEGKLKGKQSDGYGVFSWASGIRHEGEWQQGKRHGYGVVVAADGTETAGRWQNDQRVADTS
jgi:hypothetical protein